MATFQKVNLIGESVGNIEVSDELLSMKKNPQLIKDYLVAIRNNKRQWSASTQGRSEVNHSNKKPHAQKGTGNARQGFLGAPQYRGGGVVFGPKPKFDQHVRINRKERRAAKGALLIEKMAAGEFTILANTEKLETPKTKKMISFFDALNLSSKKVLFLGSHYELSETPEEAIEKIRIHDTFLLSTRNLKKARYMLAGTASGLDIVNADSIVIMEDALEEILTVLGA